MINCRLLTKTIKTRPYESTLTCVLTDNSSRAFPIERTQPQVTTHAVRSISTAVKQKRYFHRLLVIVSHQSPVQVRHSSQMQDCALAIAQWRRAAACVFNQVLCKQNPHEFVSRKP